MTQEEKELLIKDLCARLPYSVQICVLFEDYMQICGGFDYEKTLTYDDVKNYCQLPACSKTIVKPYLRPMSSMIEEEKEELLNHVLGGEGAEYFHITHDGSIDGNQEAEQDLYDLNLHWLNFGPLTTSSYIDWLNKHHFDYRGLIQKGLAISTEEYNPYKD